MNHPIVNQIERTGYPYQYREPVATEKPECDCGCLAKIKVHGNLRCWDCAEDEGVERIGQSKTA